MSCSTSAGDIQVRVDHPVADRVHHRPRAGASSSGVGLQVGADAAQLAGRAVPHGDHEVPAEEQHHVPGLDHLGGLGQLVVLARTGRSAATTNVTSPYRSILGRCAPAATRPRPRAWCSPNTFAISANCSGPVRATQPDERVRPFAGPLIQLVERQLVRLAHPADIQRAVHDRRLRVQLHRKSTFRRGLTYRGGSWLRTQPGSSMNTRPTSATPACRITRSDDRLSSHRPVGRSLHLDRGSRTVTADRIVAAWQLSLSRWTDSLPRRC